MKTEILELMNTDRKFCTDSQKEGSSAWDKNMIDEVLFGTEEHQPFTSGKESIIPQLTNLYQLDHLSFTWEPKHAFISDDNTLGVTTGIYTRTYNLKGRAVKKIGKYVTTWKKVDGKWKVVFDMGN